MTFGTSKKSIVFAAALSSAAVLHSSDPKKGISDSETERLFVRERVELAVSETGNRGSVLQSEISRFIVPTIVARGDSPSSIASKHGISAEEFISLNRFLLWAEQSGRFVLHAGKSVFVPSDPSAIRPYFSKISRAERSGRVADAIKRGEDVQRLRQISGESFFPKEPECLGLGNVLSAMLEMQKAEFDPPLPVIVDPRIETQASCANLIKNAFIQSCNLKYYTEAQRKMLLTKDLHAWILVKRLRDDFGYEQKHSSLMKAFNLNAFFDFNPITDPKKRLEYDAEIMDVYRFLRDSAPVGTIVPMYFQGSQAKKSVLSSYSAKDPHLNTHQTMFAGNIDWTVRASDVPAVIWDEKGKTFKRVPFGFETKKLSQKKASLDQTEREVSVARGELLASIDPVRNPAIVPYLQSVPKLLENAFKDPRFHTFLKKRLKGAWEGKEAFSTFEKRYVETTKERVRSELTAGTLTVEKLRVIVEWYKIPEGDLPLFEGRFKHAKLLAERRAFLANALSEGRKVELSELWPTLEKDAKVRETFSRYFGLSERAGILAVEFAKLDAERSSGVGRLRTALDFLFDFIASRADFPSSFRGEFRQTVMKGLARYSDSIELEIDGKRVDLREELSAHAEKRAETVMKPESVVRLTGPMMLDGEMQTTSDDEDRRHRMNARTRFFFEFLTTAYLPTEVLQNPDAILPSREDFDGPQSRLLARGVYSLRAGETLAEVLKERIVRYEGIADADPDRSKKISDAFRLQLYGLKMDGFLQTESEFNVGAVNENRIIPYYDLTTVPSIWKEYLAERKVQELEYERAVEPPYLRIVTLDGAGIDSKRKIYREIVSRIQASPGRILEFPALAEIGRFNDFQYELFMKRFFERSKHDSSADSADDFFRDVRPNREFYLRYADLAEIAEEISDVASLEAPNLKEVDAAVISAVFKNRHNASVAKNVLVTETYDVDGKTGFRKTVKRVREILPIVSNRSHGDFQIRIAELNGSVVQGGKLFRIEKSKSGKTAFVPTEWPTLSGLREAFDTVLRKSSADLAKRHLSPFVLPTFHDDVVRLKGIREILDQNQIDAETMRLVHDAMVETMRIDPGDVSNLAGKILSASLLESKIALHFQKTAHWLSEMDVPFEILADSDEDRGNFERTVALVNNLSEDKVLLALSESYAIRILHSALGSELSPENVYARYSNPVKNLIQKHVANQLSYDRETFLRHLKTYVQRAREVSARDEYLLERSTKRSNDARETSDSARLAVRKETVERMEKLLSALAKSENFNAVLFSFFRDPFFRTVLTEAGLSWMPFPSVSEFEEDDFRRSVFNYVAKMEKRKRAETLARVVE